MHQFHVIEQLLILAASLVLDSEDRLLRERFVSLLYSLIAMVERKEIFSPATRDMKRSSVISERDCTATTTVLTVRQCEVLRLRASGLSISEIASALSVTPYTVRSHIRDAIERLGVSGGIMAAITEARQRALI